jgi:hypothetical protein
MATWEPFCWPPERAARWGVFQAGAVSRAVMDICFPAFLKKRFRVYIFGGMR